jgi:membrane protease YdiL (CAAX protease family)
MTTANKPLIQFGWLRAFIYIIITVALLSVTLVVSGVIISANGGTEVIEEGEASITQFLITYCLLSIVFIGIALLMTRLVDRQPVIEIGFRWKGYSSQAAAGFFLALLILSCGTVVLVAMQYLFFTGVDPDVSNILYSFLLFIIVAFTEEIAFRGYILNNLMQSTNKWVALTITSVAFALFHFTNPGGDNILPMLNIFVAGFLLGINYIYTKNLWFAIFLHLGWNFFQGPILGYEVSGFAASGVFQQTMKGPVLMTGGDFGFEGSLVCLVVNIAACICLWRYYAAREARASQVDN